MHRKIKSKMNIQADNVKSQMRKGFLEYCILLSLRNKPAYASNIINTLKKGKFIVVEGTLYPILTRLKNNELLTYTWVESPVGPPRKYYSLTEKGKNFLEELNTAWGEICYIVDYIKENPITETDINNEKIINMNLKINE